MIPRLLRFALSLLTGALWRWPLALLRWITATPARIWAAIAVLAFGAALYQAHRAAQWQDQAQQAQVTLRAERITSQLAEMVAVARSRQDAQDAQTNHDALAAGADGRFAAYAAAGHSLRENAPHRAPAAKADNPGLPESPSPDAIMADISRVWITRSDWLTCDADWAYAQGAHDWAQRIAE